MVTEKVIGNIETVIAGRMWLVQQSHPRFIRSTSAFVPVAGDTGADHIVPDMLPASSSWDDVV